MNENNETPEFSVISAHNNIQVSFYSQIGEISNMKLWMQTIIDLLEKLPPTNFGLLIESLRHMQSLIKIEPAIFHVELLKTILVSHEIFFGKGANINQKGHLLQIASDNYGNDAAYDLAILLDKIEKSPELPLIEFTKSTNLDIVTLIYMILILEQEDAIIVHRPKFIEFN